MAQGSWSTARDVIARDATVAARWPLSHAALGIAPLAPVMLATSEQCHFLKTEGIFIGDDEE